MRDGSIGRRKHRVTARKIEIERKRGTERKWMKVNWIHRRRLRDRRRGAMRCRQRGRQRGRQRDRQRGRQRDRQRDRQIERERDRDRQRSREQYRDNQVHRRMEGGDWD